MFARDSGHVEGESARSFGRARGAAFLGHLRRGAVAAAVANGAVLRVPAVLRGGDDGPGPRAQAAGTRDGSEGWISSPIYHISINLWCRFTLNLMFMFILPVELRSCLSRLEHPANQRISLCSMYYRFNVVTELGCTLYRR
jgi:hypothetical protein